MRRDLLEELACPRCCRGLSLFEAEGSRGEGAPALVRGFLGCLPCDRWVPVLFGAPIFLEASVGRPADLLGALDALESRLFGALEPYADFVRNKRKRPAYDRYSAYEPFNEATRSLLPLLGGVRRFLVPGDLILDLRTRTGFTGELLAGLFPEQRVVSLFETGGDVLGYRGLRFWIKEHAPNLDFIFASARETLPFKDACASLVLGLDLFHEGAEGELLREVRRVSRASAPLLFPHVHLANSEPRPFFERGGTILSGSEVRARAEALFSPSGRRSFVLSEKDLFEAKEPRIEDQSNTEHYNGCLVVVPAELEGMSLVRDRKSPSSYARARVIKNPLVAVDPGNGRVTIDRQALGGAAEELLARHPMYLSRLHEVLPRRIAVFDRVLVYLGERGLTPEDMAAQLGQGSDEILRHLLRLEQEEIIRLENVSAGRAELCSFLSTQREPDRLAECAALLESAAARFPENTFLEWEDGSTFSNKELFELAQKAASWFSVRGLVAGDRVLCDAARHPETVIAFFGARLLGLVVGLVDASATDVMFGALEDAFEPDLCLLFSRRSCARAPVVWLAAEGPGSFSEEVMGAEPARSLSSRPSNEDALVLFTSGSSGAPKGVILSSAALYRSARAMDTIYPLAAEERVLCTAALHTMSGFRNHMLWPLVGGATLVLSAEPSLASPLLIFEHCAERKIQVLSAGPALLAGAALLSGKIPVRLGGGLRLVVSTGAPLSRRTKEEAEAALGCNIRDYYGLTETSGICIAEDSKARSFPKAEGAIGKPINCVISVELEANSPAIEANDLASCQGELAIFCENLGRYLDRQRKDGLTMRAGWLFSGDLAQITGDGQVLLGGRLDRMLIDRQGENVHPEVIERLIESLDGIARAYVLGVPGGDGLERIAAVIVPKPGRPTRPESIELAIREGLAGRLSARHLPTFVLATDTLPLNAAGKVDRAQVRRLFEQHGVRS